MLMWGREERSLGVRISADLLGGRLAEIWLLAEVEVLVLLGKVVDVVNQTVWWK